MVTRCICVHLEKLRAPLGVYATLGIGNQQDAGEGTDFAAIEQGYVSITPLTIDMTAYGSLSTLGAWLDLQG